jgi:transposase InsO family protein
MKSAFSRVGLAQLCGWFGITRQAYYKYHRQAVNVTSQEELVVKQVKEIRKKHPRIGARKLHWMLQPFFQENQIKLGRDGLFDLLSGHHLLVRRRKRKVHTTQSFHWLRKYPNLIKEIQPYTPNQIWVSDITYWKINTGAHLYISLITDMYSHRIVGYNVAATLDAQGCIDALKMALSALGNSNQNRLIHHSDRGVQYCSGEYVKLLKNSGIRISMTENSEPIENSVAERVNGIIKDEYLENYQVETLQEAMILLTTSIARYNLERPHLSIGMLTPNEVHVSTEPISTKRLWRNYYRKPPTFVNTYQD